MERHILQFITDLRAAGVRVSTAESLDGLRALATVGLADRDTFKTALCATLVKRVADRPTFDALFDLQAVLFSGTPLVIL